MVDFLLIGVAVENLAILIFDFDEPVDIVIFPDGLDL
jgi:hypothetical protein